MRVTFLVAHMGCKPNKDTYIRSLTILAVGISLIRAQYIIILYWGTHLFLGTLPLGINLMRVHNNDYIRPCCCRYKLVCGSKYILYWFWIDKHVPSFTNTPLHFLHSASRLKCMVCEYLTFSHQELVPWFSRVNFLPFFNLFQNFSHSSFYNDFTVIPYYSFFYIINTPSSPFLFPFPCTNITNFWLRISKFFYFYTNYVWSIWSF